MQDAIKTFLIQFILVYFLQSIIFIFCLYVFSDKKIGKRTFLFTSVAFMLGTLLIRALPIHFGVHTLVSLLLLIFLGNRMLRLPAYVAIKATLFAAIILLILESLNVSSLAFFLGHERFDTLMGNKWIKNLLGLAVNLVFLLIVTAIYLWKRRRQLQGNAVQTKGGSKR